MQAIVALLLGVCALISANTPADDAKGTAPGAEPMPAALAADKSAWGAAVSQARAAWDPQWQGGSYPVKRGGPAALETLESASGKWDGSGVWAGQDDAFGAQDPAWVKTKSKKKAKNKAIAKGLAKAAKAAAKAAKSSKSGGGYDYSKLGDGYGDW